MKNQYKSLLFIIVAFFIFSSGRNKNYYDEQYRPQFHFSPEKYWQNDPNGLVYYEGEYHLFYQYNPKANEPGTMHWGHAVSKDLIHWNHLPVAIHPDEGSGDEESCSVLSGSAIVDENNILGKQQGQKKTLVIFYTSQNCGQRLAYSTDGGRTWLKYEGNPVIAYKDNEDARDPKVIWHEPSQKFVMVLFRKESENENSKGVSFYTSENLTEWEFKSHLHGYTSCPDLFPMQVSNRPEETKWILFDGDGSYLIGNFDGESFTPETARMKSDFGKNYYAPQTWNNTHPSDGRVLQIACMRGGEYPNMPFNGQMTFPSELKLTKFSFGYKITRSPVKEVEKLHGKQYKWENRKLIPGINQNIVKSVKGDCLHIKGEFDLKSSSSFGFIFRTNRKEAGTELQYDVRRGTLSFMGVSAPVVPVNNRISLEILIDRASIEVYANGGQAVISNCFTPVENARGLVLYCTGGEIVVDKLGIFKMDTAWKADESQE